MTHNQTLLCQIGQHPTPFYLYQMNILKSTLDQLIHEASTFQLHYAVKANANTQLLKTIAAHKIGADCVSGREIELALEAGIPPNKIVFAGVGKTDNEISYALKKGIFCFNIESAQELEVLNQLAKEHQKTARIALRINPDIDAQTHNSITTGLPCNKFGIDPQTAHSLWHQRNNFSHIQFSGLHFHIGSQITNMSVFKRLCQRVNRIHHCFRKIGFTPDFLNLGGGLGIDYSNPTHGQIPNFKSYFKIFRENLEILAGQKVHFEPGRSVVAQCGVLVTRVLYLKKQSTKTFVILDAGMTELLRPALYQSQHIIENISSHQNRKSYDVVGPVCESTDQFGENISLHECHRGDILLIHSAGAYGEAMASNYNQRSLSPPQYFN